MNTVAERGRENAGLFFCYVKMQEK